MNNIHERGFRIFYDDHSSSCFEFLMTKNEPTLHQPNVNVLMKEIYKLENDIYPSIIDDMQNKQ